MATPFAIKRLSEPRSPAKNILAGEDSDDDGEYDNYLMVELKRLQRQYRLMEDARHAIMEQSGKLSKQRNYMDYLKMEKTEYDTSLKIAAAPQFQADDQWSIATILEALNRYQLYKDAIAGTIAEVRNMEYNVDLITHKLIEQKLRIQAIFGEQMTEAKAERKIRLLEDRLYLVTTQFDEYVSKNKALKQEVNMMLKFRGVMYKRMMAVKKISSRIKKRMGDIVLEATMAYDGRDDWVTKINHLRERNEKESRQHVLEIKEFYRAVHHERKIQEFLEKKNKVRVEMESGGERATRKLQAKVDELDAILKAYKRSFVSILKLAGSKNIESLVASYLEQEQKNFAMFESIVDVNNQASNLLEDIQNIKHEIEKLSETAKERSKFQGDVIKAFEEELEEKNAEMKELEEKNEAADAEFEEFGELLKGAFDIAGCPEDGLFVLLGNKDGLQPHNALFYLQSLEDRVDRLLYQKGEAEVHKIMDEGGQPPKKGNIWVGGVKPAPSGGPFKPQVHITGRIDMDEDDEQEDMRMWLERPIEFEDMKELVRAKLKSAEISGSSPDQTGSETSTAPSISASQISAAHGMIAEARTASTVPSQKSVVANPDDSSAPAEDENDDDNDDD